MQGNAAVRVTEILKNVRSVVRTAGPSPRLDNLDGEIVAPPVLTDIAVGLLPRVRVGYFPVFVGVDRTRFLISTRHMTHEVFQDLLKRCEEKNRLQHKGGLTLHCEPAVFECSLWQLLISTKDPGVRITKLQELLELHAFGTD